MSAAVLLALPLTLRETDVEAEPDRLPVWLSLDDGVAELLEEGVPLPLKLPVAEELLLPVPVLREVGMSVLLELGVPVMLTLPVPLRVLELEVDPEVVLEEDTELVEDKLQVADAELDEVAVAREDEEGVCAGEALRRLAMLRPRKVMEERAASASPASHSVDS